MDPADPKDTLDTKNTLEAVRGRGQDDDLSSPDAPEAQRHERNFGRQARSLGATPTRRYQHFADKLAEAMKHGNLSASQIAAKVWGTAKDRRGYTVARNRDRIGHYLSGNSYPEPENLKKLADAIGVPLDELAMPEVADNPGPRPLRGQPSGSFHVSLAQDHPGMMRVQMDKLLDIATAQMLFKLISDAEARLEAQLHLPLGSVINGNKPEDEEANGNG